MEVWIARVRVVAVLFGVVEVGLLTENYPPRYESYAWSTTAVFGLGALLRFVASAGSAKPGTGLGLFIAHSMAEAYGGSLGVESVLQRGSVLRLELPVD